MRKARYTVPIWPYFGAVVCLFVLTLVAPITWKNVTKSQAPRLVSEKRGAASAPPRALSTRLKADRGDRHAGDTANGEGARNELIAVFPSPTAVTYTEPALRAEEVRVQPAPVDLLSLSAPRQRVATAPPVADRYQVPVQVIEPAATRTLATSGPATAPKRATVAATDHAPRPAPVRAETFAKTPHGWPRATALIEQFRVLQRHPATKTWATQAVHTLEQINRLNALGATELPPLLDGLTQIAADGIRLAENEASPTMRSRIVRAGYATVRRELIWRQVHHIAASSGATSQRISNQAAQDRLANVEARIGRNPNAVAWRNYLRLDDVRASLQQAGVEERAAVARKVLGRMTSPKLTTAQKAVLEKSPFSELQAELRRWVVTPIAYPQLLADIEKFEQTRSADAARRVAMSYQVIRWSEDQGIAQLASLLESHYRNANVRVAVRDDLLNRLLPQQDDFEEEVNEEIIGAQVLGNAQGSANMRTVLIPDQQRWRFGLEVEGEVESQTAATRGPATFFNDGYSRYQARTLFQIDRRGVFVSDAEAEASMNSRLTGFRTLFDSLPVIGWVARGIARQQHDDQTEMARWVSETRLETRMRERLDTEVQARLEEAEAKVEQKIATPLRKLDLKPSAVEMRTTEQRLIARYRLAADDHLGAFTPRPQAPSDSMLSVQVHETMLNNTLVQLDLAGRRTKLRQLYRDLADAFDRSDLEVPDDIPENITVQFADTNPVRVQCDEGKLTLTLRITELKNRRNSWHNFEVRADYLPDASDLHANLVRHGVVKLIGRRLSFGDQIVLRTIFSRTLSKNQPFNVINRKLAENPAIADLDVNQFVIEDGWIGVALGPQRVATRTEPAAPRQPAPIVNAPSRTTTVPAPVVDVPSRSTPRPDPRARVPAPIVNAPVGARRAPARVTNVPAPVVNAIR